jgi:hypothetical protein
MDTSWIVRVNVTRNDPDPSTARSARKDRENCHSYNATHATQRIRCRCGGSLEQALDIMTV